MKRVRIVLDKDGLPVEQEHPSEKTRDAKAEADKRDAKAITEQFQADLRRLRARVRPAL